MWFLAFRNILLKIEALHFEKSVAIHLSNAIFETSSSSNSSSSSIF